jgi:Tol biopolymer transport system component
MGVAPRGVVILAIGMLLSGCTYLARASVDSAGGDADNTSGPRPSLSADGRYVAFFSLAHDIAAPGQPGVFVRDLNTNTTTRVSVEPQIPDEGYSSEVSISGNGRYVAYDSPQSHVAGDDGLFVDVFVYDVQTGLTTRASLDTAGGNPDGNSFQPFISDDGRYVAFTGQGGDLVTGDNNGKQDVFVRDMQLGVTTRVSVDAAGGDADDISFVGSISGDGRFVAVLSQATDLVTGAAGRVYVRDLQLATTAAVDLDNAGGAPDQITIELPFISGNGRYVAFASPASDLVAGDGNGFQDIFVRDLQLNTTVRASVDAAGGDANAASRGFPTISADGRFVAFSAHASDLVASDANGNADVFVRNVQTNKTSRTSVTKSGAEAHGPSFLPWISEDGSYVAFQSQAPDLVPDDGNGRSDIFVRSR